MIIFIKRTYVFRSTSGCAITRLIIVVRCLCITSRPSTFRIALLTKKRRAKGQKKRMCMRVSRANTRNGRWRTCKRGHMSNPEGDDDTHHAGDDTLGQNGGSTCTSWLSLCKDWDDAVVIPFLLVKLGGRGSFMMRKRFYRDLIGLKIPCWLGSPFRRSVCRTFSVILQVLGLSWCTLPSLSLPFPRFCGSFLWTSQFRCLRTETKKESH